MTTPAEDRAAPLFDLFWENSTLGPATIGRFADRMARSAGDVPAAPALQYPGADVELPRPRDALGGVMDARSSERGFADRLLQRRELGAIFSAFARTRRGARTFPSAGATYAVDVFALLNKVDGGLSGRAVYYNHDNHSLSDVAAVPEWPEYADAVNLECEGTPHVLVVFVAFPERTTAKYGERGGRFVLFEVGHAAQNLALRLAACGLAGCEAGGLFDRRIKELLRLERTDARIALGYACGLPRDARPRRLPHVRALVRRGART